MISYGLKLSCQYDHNQCFKSPAIAAAIAGDSCWRAQSLGDVIFNAMICKPLIADVSWIYPLNGPNFSGR